MWVGYRSDWVWVAVFALNVKWARPNPDRTRSMGQNPTRPFDGPETWPRLENGERPNTHGDPRRRSPSLLRSHSLSPAFSRSRARRTAANGGRPCAKMAEFQKPQWRAFSFRAYYYATSLARRADASGWYGREETGRGSTSFARRSVGNLSHGVARIRVREGDGSIGSGPAKLRVPFWWLPSPFSAAAAAFKFPFSSLSSLWCFSGPISESEVCAPFLVASRFWELLFFFPVVCDDGLLKRSIFSCWLLDLRDWEILNFEHGNTYSSLEFAMVGFFWILGYLEIWVWKCWKSVFFFWRLYLIFLVKVVVSLCVSMWLEDLRVVAFL